MSSQDENLLRQLYQSLAQVELMPSDPRYVPLHEHPECFGPDVVKELIRDISWSTEGSLFFLSGLRGSGKSTQMLRLRDSLAQQGFAAVRLEAEDYLNLREPIDIVDFLFFLVGGISDAVDQAGWLGSQSAMSRGWERLSQWLGSLPKRIALTPEATVGIDIPHVVAASLKAELRSDESFVGQLRKFLDGRLSELTIEANRIVADLVDELRESWPEHAGGEWKGLVVLVDSLDHVRGADFTEVRRALVELFDKQPASITFDACRTVFVVPPWIQVDYASIRRLANIKITHNPRSGNDQAPFKPGYTTLRRVLERRCPPDTELTTFLDEHDIEGFIRDSGGHLRDLLRLVRGASVAADSLPFPSEAIARGRQELRDGLIPIADDERECLRLVAESHQLPLRTQEAWQSLAGLLDLHLILGYKNGETWYDVHPLIRADLT